MIISIEGRPGQAMSAPVLEPLPSNTCPQCLGAGYLDGAIECPNCYGHGEVFQLDESIDLELVDPAPRYVLCQDCLAVLPYTDDRHQEREFCSCGGQFCGCDACNADAHEILSSRADK